MDKKRNMINEIYEITDIIRKHISRNKASVDDDEVMEIIEKYVFTRQELAFRDYEETLHIINSIFYNLRKDLSILQPYIEDDDIKEIMVNGKDKIFVEKSTGIEETGDSFYSAEALEELIRRIAAKVHREFNELNPILDARLDDGSRVNGVYKNIALNGPALTIRKFPKEALTMERLVANGTLGRKAADFLKACVEAGLNIFISGGTSSGKTTFLNCLADYIPPEERLVVIEDSAELQIKNHTNIVRLECRNSNIQGRGEVTMTDLIKTSLRMRPSRIIVGEVRGSEVADMINACNTGHDGSLSTGHGNSIYGMIKRLESMYLQAADFPVSAIRAQIAEGIDLIVHLGRMPDNSRKVLEIAELTGISENEIRLNRLFEYDIEKGLVPTGNRVQNTFKFKMRGIEYGY